jgi:hypothetical protein
LFASEQQKLLNLQNSFERAFQTLSSYWLPHFQDFQKCLFKVTSGSLPLFKSYVQIRKVHQPLGGEGKCTLLSSKEFDKLKRI